MSTLEAGSVTPDWLALRANADFAARANGLVAPLLARLDDRPIVVRDLGCGTGSMGRWLAGRLPGPQHWIMQDRDPVLLDIAVANVTGPAADGSPVTVVAQQGDITGLRAADLADTSLVTVSALLDILTADEVAGLVAACAEAGCPALLTLSVVGRVELTPADPLDDAITEAFNAHQRRVVDGRRLLGPDAVDVTADLCRGHGATVSVLPSPWRLGAAGAALTREWLRGWVSAAAAQHPALDADAYLRRRLAEVDAGALRVVVHHSDLLALPAEGRPS
jgi:SAM-dependent methyltransferase